MNHLMTNQLLILICLPADQKNSKETFEGLERNKPLDPQSKHNSKSKTEMEGRVRLTFIPLKPSLLLTVIRKPVVAKHSYGYSYISHIPCPTSLYTSISQTD